MCAAFFFKKNFRVIVLFFFWINFYLAFYCVAFFVNNIAFYRKSNEILGREFIFNDWIDLTTETTWQTWFDAENWSAIEGQVEEIRVSVDGKSIYDSTFGVSNIVLNDNSILNVSSDKVTIITGTVWKEYSQIPV